MVKRYYYQSSDCDDVIGVVDDAVKSVTPPTVVTISDVLLLVVGDERRYRGKT